MSGGGWKAKIGWPRAAVIWMAKLIPDQEVAEQAIAASALAVIASIFVRRDHGLHG